MARIITDPFEMTDLDYSGWSSSTTSANLFVTSADSRKWKGYGGNYSVYRGSSSTAFSFTTPKLGGAQHIFVKIAYKPLVANCTLNIRFVDDVNTTMAQVSSASTGSWTAHRGTATLIQNSGVPPVTNAWQLIEIEYYAHDSLGIIRVWQNDVLIINATNVDTNNTVNPLDKVLFNTVWGMYIDDIAINNVTLRYDSEASGPFVVGETISSVLPGGGSAVVTSITDNGTTGVLTLERWNGTAFVDGQTFSGSTSLASANVDAPNAAFKNGFEPNSSRIGNGFIVAIPPNDNGTNSDLLGSDGNSVNNYLLVDERVTVNPPADYVEANTVGQVDTYKGSVSTYIPPVVSEILCVAVATNSQSSLTGIDGMNSVVRIGGTDYDGDRKALGVDYKVILHDIPVDPSIASNLDQSWTLNTLTDANFEFGARFTA